MRLLPFLAIPIALAIPASAQPQSDVSAQDRFAHERMIVLDTHLDIPSRFDDGQWDFGERHRYEFDLSQVDLPRMIEGGLDGGFFVVYTPQGELTPEGYREARDRALVRIAGIHRVIGENEALSLALTEKPWPEIQETLEKRYSQFLKRMDQIKNEDVFEMFMNAFAHTLDPHSSYLSPRSSEEYRIQMSLNYDGIGASLQIQDEYVTVLSVTVAGTGVWYSDGRLTFQNIANPSAVYQDLIRDWPHFLNKSVRDGVESRLRPFDHRSRASKAGDPAGRTPGTAVSSSPRTARRPSSAGRPPRP